MSVTSEAHELLELLREQKLDKWGWVIYRTSYSDQQVWSDFRTFLLERMKQAVGKLGDPVISETVDLTFFDDDAAKFDNASREDLRRHFKQWRSAACLREQPRAELYQGIVETPRYEFFFQVDGEVLEQFKREGPSINPLDTKAHVKLIQAAWQPRGDEEEPEERMYDEIGGIREHDVGWMKSAIGCISYSFYIYMSGMPDIWTFVYQRPPTVFRY
ncbi:hypothetical protein BDZ85DRAFT_277963 [Elsinoe ampelina]|uniref:Uncharacterized protein n=1 Tax=Elsinoe ampelina TaxID=302913 RepID=A0A6A6GRH1_9PEZI|nr:hypothetical protein BDZ85DRAFT_277963 [Elsinoe ampelina]